MKTNNFETSQSAYSRSPEQINGHPVGGAALIGGNAVALAVDMPQTIGKLKNEMSRRDLNIPSEADKWLHDLLAKLPANIDSQGQPRVRSGGMESLADAHGAAALLFEHGVTVYDGQGPDYQDGYKRFEMISYQDAAGGAYTISSQLPFEDQKYEAASITYTTGATTERAFSEMLYFFRTHNEIKHKGKHYNPWNIREGVASYTREGSAGAWVLQDRQFVTGDQSNKLAQRYSSLVKNAASALENKLSEIELSRA